jgi:hypothetical protein
VRQRREAHVTAPTRACLTFGELADYWSSDLSAAEVERIESHVFECGECAARLAESERLRRQLGETIRAGAFHAFITDAVVNTLSRDGVRVRSYTVEPGGQVQCAVWADDDVLVARLRGDFTGVTSVSAVMRFDTGEEMDRVVDAPVRDGSHELLMALSAEGIRRAPEVPIRLTVTLGPTPSDGQVLAEYVFDHRGAHNR